MASGAVHRSGTGRGKEKRKRGTGGGVPTARPNSLAAHQLHEYKVRIPRDPALARATALFKVAPRYAAKPTHPGCHTTVAQWGYVARWLANPMLTPDLVRTREGEKAESDPVIQAALYHYTRQYAEKWSK